jgi:hypothetical protein
MSMADITIAGTLPDGVDRAGMFAVMVHGCEADGGAGLQVGEVGRGAVAPGRIGGVVPARIGTGVRIGIGVNFSR